jgi:DNA-binding PucR family transcriptional regulator
VYLARGGAAQTVTLSGLGVLGLLLQLDRPEELSAFVQSRLGPLREYDQVRSTALEETLRMFLREQCSVTATGKSLFIHPNTVKMRLRRIEELLGIHLDRPDDLLDLRSEGNSSPTPARSIAHRCSEYGTSQRHLSRLRDPRPRR